MSHSWSQLGIEQDFFSLSIHTWIIKIHKYIFFSSQHKQQQQLQCRTAAFSWVDNCKDFFFSLYTHATRVSLNVFFLYFLHFLHFSLTYQWSLNLCSDCLSLRLYVLLSLTLSLRIALSDSISMYFSLSSSLHTHTSHFLSLKRFLSLTINLQ